MRALVTNDDGIGSVGLTVLARAALDVGLEVIVVAPGWDSSGASASLTAVEEGGRVMVRTVELDALPGVPAHAVEAPPAYIVRAGALGAFGPPPDVIVSGINRGLNTGHAVLHSGTVGAALTGATHGLRALAVSVEHADDPYWDTARVAATTVLSWLVNAPMATVLNVNVPNRPIDAVGGIEVTRLAAFGAVQSNVTESGSGWVRVEHREIEADHEEGTDAAAVAAGSVAVTPLMAVCEADDISIDGLAGAIKR